MVFDWDSDFATTSQTFRHLHSRKSQSSSTSSDPGAQPLGFAAFELTECVLLRL